MGYTRIAAIRERTRRAGRSTFQVKIRRAGQLARCAPSLSRRLAAQQAVQHAAQMGCGVMASPATSRSASIGGGSLDT